MSKSKKASALQQAQEASAEAGAEVKDVNIDVGREEALQALSMASNAEVKQLEQYLRQLRVSGAQGAHAQPGVSAVMRANQTPPQWNGTASQFEAWWLRFEQWTNLHGLTPQQSVQALNGAVTG